MKTVYKFAAPLFVLALLAVGVVGVAFAREAERIDDRPSEIEVYGTVDAITSSAWTIDGQVYSVNAETEIKGTIQPGAQVKVHLTPGASGALVIREVELAGADDLFEDNSADDQSSDDSFDDHGQNSGEDSDRDQMDDNSQDDSDDRDGSDDSDDGESENSGQDSSDDDSDQDDDDSDDDDDDDDDDNDDDHGDDDGDDHGDDNNDDD